MTVSTRIMMCRLIEKMDANPEFSKTLGLENRSTFRGRNIRKLRDDKIKLKLEEKYEKRDSEAQQQT